MSVDAIQQLAKAEEQADEMLNEVKEQAVLCQTTLVKNKVK
ncbi:hypothetical protein [Tetragenococcus koreensis]|nr:hypothetical protein [Tetragenococcus koreensis]